MPSHPSSRTAPERVPFEPVVESKVEFELLDKVIGSGNYSTVHLARNVVTQELLATKVVDLKMRKYYEREIKALSSVHASSNKEHVIPLVQFGEDEEHGYIFTPYMSCGTLGDYVGSKGSLPELEALDIFSQIVSGVETVHQAGFAHSDLKPENIMYDANTKKATLFDFGLSLEMDYHNTVSDCCGSPLYMAPEVLLRKKHNAVFSDIWSLGIILYYLLFADFPWVDIGDMEDLLEAILHDVISFPRRVSSGVKSLILMMLDRNPGKRPSLQAIKEMITKIVMKLKGAVPSTGKRPVRTPR